MAQYTLEDMVDANERRTELAILTRRFHQKYDLLVTPVQSKPVPSLGTAPEMPFAFPFNITQQPAASVPAIIGPQYGDAIVLRASRTFEKAQPFLTPHLESLREL
ncbi:hypothetical protein QEV83_10915 [Methylocapsa sp. D3K7]|uniref:hypothetical protein n=1 Tax=Methylocapsa sp. D3K7 TaxID=3041435 RepID=UPI00244E6628|nr:hypothetical protein [Methylocapsa sp. D3K7]WGJ13227.1 hypothetical protein QEV83_10915 [Methylocapsa sp. D3K7]